MNGKKQKEKGKGKGDKGKGKGDAKAKPKAKPINVVCRYHKQYGTCVHGEHCKFKHE